MECVNPGLTSLSWPIYGDRFIPSRTRSNFALFGLSSTPDSPYSTLLKAAMFNTGSDVGSPTTPDKAVGLNGIIGNEYKTKTRQPLLSLFPFGSSHQFSGGDGTRAPRKISKTPYLVLDVSGFEDDFYQNLVDWSSDNVLAIGLGHSVFLWNASTFSVVNLFDGVNDGIVCSVGWDRRGTNLSIGTTNESSRFGMSLVVIVWNRRSMQPLMKFCEHTAASKAIAWSPNAHGLLASGGGTADRCIRFWSTTKNKSISCLDIGSQVCNLVWSKKASEFVSTHGFLGNEIIVWKYPTISKLATLVGQASRALHLAISPDGDVA